MHSAVKKAKAMLTIIEKKFGSYQGQFYCNIFLTGINVLDRNEIRMYTEMQLKKIKEKIEIQFTQNEILINGEWNDNFQEGYYLKHLKDNLAVADALIELHSFIWSNYPEIDLKKSKICTLSSVDSKEKFQEAKNFFLVNKVDGFIQETIGVFECGKTKTIYRLTFEHTDLLNIKSVYHTYL